MSSRCRRSTSKRGAHGDRLHRLRTPGLLVPYLGNIAAYIVRVLQSQDEPDSVLSVVTTLGDLCLSCREQMQPHIAPIMTAIIAGLEDTDYDRDLKCAFLQCIGDIALNVLCGSNFRQFIDPVMVIGHQMYQASCTIDVRGDPESEEYVLSLWHSLCEMYSNVIQSASTDDVMTVAGYFGNVVQLVFTVTGKAAEEDTFFKALALLGDLASVVGKSNQQLRHMGRSALLTQEVSALLHKAHQTYRQKDQQKQIRWVQRCLNDLQR
ncbi:hypothetical protein STCU_11470 [Strigomonas culicis]|uniref:Importin subunit beta-1/Transportin-1-like TPR repeats domain-containing protein n=1 Tax=Strigomonas culicis TaxID=28005 RepID=S9V0B9_9TRYP|nr:hypothetical protein STCU_11470 [Strigomonas culicis]|eukprot:EPY16220.1 hypothetical protein STCU_11470 [Strigomonas culicis]